MADIISSSRAEEKERYQHTWVVLAWTSFSSARELLIISAIHLRQIMYYGQACLGRFLAQGKTPIVLRCCSASAGIMAPPCVLQAKQKNMTQTVVAKIIDDPRNVLSMHCQTWVWDGGGASAYVEIAAGEHKGHYIVLTNKQLCEEHSIGRRLQTQLQERPGSPQAVWVRPLTRRLQRLFHWGDVLATQNDVARMQGRRWR